MRRIRHAEATACGTPRQQGDDRGGRRNRPGPLFLPLGDPRPGHGMAGTDLRHSHPQKNQAAAGSPSMLARDLMTTDVATIAPNAPLRVVAETMVERSVTGLPVVDGTARLLGLVTESDLLHRLAAAEQVQHGYLWGIFHAISRQADEYARS